MLRLAQEQACVHTIGLQLPADHTAPTHPSRAPLSGARVCPTCAREATKASTAQCVLLAAAQRLTS
jgi:hypothetical protein